MKGMFGHGVQLLLLSEYFYVRLAVRKEMVFLTPLPCGFQAGTGNVPIGPAFPGHFPQILPEFLDRRPAEKPITVVDFEYDELRLEDNRVRNHRIVSRIRVLGYVQILLHLAPGIGQKRPMRSYAATELVRLH